MAEMVIKIRNGANYLEGDILECFNNRRIRCTHAQHICHVKFATRNSDGLMLETELAKDWFEAVCQYKFERRSRSTVARILLSDMSEEIISNRPNINGEAIDVPLFIARRKLKATHYLFGTNGQEYWYGGKTDVSNAKMTTVWNSIETKTVLREVDHNLFPLGRVDKRHHFSFSVDDLNDARANALVQPELDLRDPDNPVTIRKRIHFVDWENDLGLSGRTIVDVRNKDKEVVTIPEQTRDESTITKARN